MAKVRFWEQRNFFGVDFSPLTRDAKEEIYAQPVVGNFDYRILLAPSCSFHGGYFVLGSLPCRCTNVHKYHQLIFKQYR
jgi:histone-arginine methyltransferase CARM1